MLNNRLEKARKYEENNMSLVSKHDRPAFHVTGGIGWINDPNGFSLYKNEYHLFYQYHPYSTEWGPMHWGHVKTKDFVKWERLPIALAPDSEADKKGCFSGSALELPDGRHLLMYTGVTEEKNANGELKDIQQQCIAVGDGINYKKYENNPVIDSTMLPDFSSKYDFRDPKIWKENNKYYAVIATCTDDQSGAILLYESEDAFNWNYKTTIDRCNNEYGKMWECPDFFKLEDKHVLIISPQEMPSKGLEFHAGNCTAFFTGTYHSDSGFNRQNVQAIDYGIDFYAPQTLLSADGRRIMIAWMQNWTTSVFKPQWKNFFGEMTFPRELSIKNGRIYQLPVKEIENYYGKKTAYENVPVSEKVSLPDIEGRVIDMTIKLRPANEKTFNSFNINFAENHCYLSTIHYDAANNLIRIDRSRCGFPNDIVHSREFAVNTVNGELKLRVLLDKHSMELFVNDGEQAATMIIYTDQDAKSISFDSDGHAIMDIIKYNLNFEE